MGDDRADKGATLNGGCGCGCGWYLVGVRFEAVQDQLRGPQRAQLVAVGLEAGEGRHGHGAGPLHINVLDEGHGRGVEEEK